MSDVLQLEEQLVGVLVLAAAEFAAIVAEHVVDDGPMLLKGRQARVVEGLHRGDRQLGGAEPCPGVAGVAGDHGLQVGCQPASNFDPPRQPVGRLSGQGRFLKRQLSLQVSTMSQ